MAVRMMPAPSQQQGLQPGIYFGLTEDVYHADTALSRSDIVNILDTPNTYWMRSWMNPTRDSKKKTPDMIYGAAFHCLLFEPQEFSKRFFIFPSEDFEHRKYLITDAEFAALVASIKVIRVGKDSSKFLTKGMPEVTIVFDYNGVRYRVRIDFFGVVINTEFKTARTLEEGYLKREFHDRGLDIQFALYTIARVMFKKQYVAGEAHVYGKVDPVFFKRFMSEEMNEFIFIFQRKSAPYPFLPLLPDEETYDRGFRRLEKASRIYKEYMNTYGAGTPWPVSEGKIKHFSMIYGINEGN